MYLGRNLQHPVVQDYDGKDPFYNTKINGKGRLPWDCILEWAINEFQGYKATLLDIELTKSASKLT